MEVPQVVALLGAGTALLGSVATFVKIKIDRKHGMRGTEIQAGQLDLDKMNAVFTGQGSLIEHLNEDNANLRMEVKELREWRKQDAKRLDELEARQDHFERVERVRVRREEILVEHITQGLGPPVPELPPIPNPPGV